MCLLIEYLIANGRMAGADASKKFRQIVQAVDYCHQKGIVHRNLKVYIVRRYVCVQQSALKKDL